MGYVVQSPVVIIFSGVQTISALLQTRECVKWNALDLDLIGCFVTNCVKIYSIGQVKYVSLVFV